MIRDFVQKSTGLTVQSFDSQTICILQKADDRVLPLRLDQVEEVLSRTDGEDKVFLQINFVEGRKILITDNLIGFKPAKSVNLDLSRLPRVVTTPDIQSVVTAIEETLANEATLYEELDLLRKVFEAVVQGAEDVGFDLPKERDWLQRLLGPRFSASA